MNIPVNPYRLTTQDLEQVKLALLELTTSAEVDPKVRVQAAGKMSDLLDQVMKYTPAQDDTQQKHESEDDDPLRGLVLVGAA